MFDVETKDVVIPVCTILGGAYRDDIKAFFNARLTAFWLARQKDMDIIRQRDTPGANKFQLPDPLCRETVKMFAVVIVCGSIMYPLEHFAAKDQGSQLMLWLVNAVGQCAFLRFMAVQAILVGYRGSLLFSRTPRLSV